MFLTVSQLFWNWGCIISIMESSIYKFLFFATLMQLKSETKPTPLRMNDDTWSDT